MVCSSIRGCQPWLCIEAFKQLMARHCQGGGEGIGISSFLSCFKAPEVVPMHSHSWEPLGQMIPKKTFQPWKFLDIYTETPAVLWATKPNAWRGSSVSSVLLVWFVSKSIISIEDSSLWTCKSAHTMSLPFKKLQISTQNCLRSITLVQVVDSILYFVI